MSSLCLGVGDFLASQSSERIGALHALTGMLMISTVMISAFILFSEGIRVPDTTDYWPGIGFASLHAVMMACALLLFFHAMAIGRINVVAPIVAAHPVFILLFAMFSGMVPSVLQLSAMAGTIIGVVIVGACGHTETTGAIRLASLPRVVAISVAAGFFYAIAVAAMQSAVPYTGEWISLWLGRSIGMLSLLTIFLCRRRSPLPPNPKWWLFFCFHGVLDSGGILFLILGSANGINAMTAVVSSTFSVVTVILARLILKEPMSIKQFFGVVFIFLSVGAMAYGE